jgi:large subunit ribosomal protein L34e
MILFLFLPIYKVIVLNMPKTFINSLNFLSYMVRGSRRSRSLRRVFVKTPKHTKLVHTKRKHAKPHCANCGDVLKGVATGRPYMMAKLSKTQKRPERPYAGMLCSKCMRAKIKNSL